MYINSSLLYKLRTNMLSNSKIVKVSYLFFFSFQILLARALPPVMVSGDQSNSITKDTIRY